jgi:hypothetical protein
MVFLLYLLGSVVLISGLACIASALGAAPGLVTGCAAALFAAATLVTAAARLAPTRAGRR